MENIIKIIKKNQLFSGVSEENIKNISKDIKYYIKTYNKGEIIAHEDDECRSLSLVLSGVVEIQRLYLNGKYIVLNRLNEGDVFGEALVFSKARTYPATFISLNESKVLFIDKSDILKILTKEEKVLENFISLFTKHYNSRDKLTENLNWKEIRFVNIDKSYFYNEAKEETKRKSYLIKGDIFYIEKIQGDWVLGAFIGKKTTKGWLKKSTLNY